jgi:hypothetical protein
MLATTLFAQKTAEEWLNIVDRNMVYKTAESVTKMTVHLPGGTERVYRMNAKVKEDKFALIEFLEPIRDKGTRYLKHEDNMWIYFPRVDRSMLISGHMLREGVQGGDLSFEDLSESSSWADKYTAEIVEEDAISVRIKMTSKDMSVSYPFKEILIDRNTGVPIQTINSGVGEVPIKQILTVETQQFGNRFYPVVIEIRSLLVEDKWTRFEVEKIEFGEDFPDKMFSKEALEVY